ncbi:adenosine deaminase [Paraliobacillus ryukyuensis]|uniref:adenosine deaminase n=1 Tax=Paraliobacillus ryukyuensis TaxID=200904 RepID=UPI0009A8A33C|nr:adenosine deaminase [Paraliobacillus ryukyuensis]
MVTKQAYSFIKQLPKVDLHLHLDGSVKPKTLLELARAQGVTLPTQSIADLSSYMSVGDNCTSLAEYLRPFDLVAKVLQTKQALERVAYELVEQAKQDNCAYIEVRFAPQQHREQGLQLEEVLNAVMKGLTKGSCMFGVETRVITCCMRHHDAEVNKEVIRVAAKYLNKGLVAVDLAGDENSFPTSLFRDTFALANQLEIPITIHAGEAAGAESIKEAVKQLGAARIGHGVRLTEDDKLLHEIKKREIPLEMCPISNLQTKATDGWGHYPIRYYFDQGIKVTVHTDNMTVSDTCITKEFSILMDHFHFTITELNQLTINAIDASFLSFQEKKNLKQKCLKQMKKQEQSFPMVV